MAENNAADPTAPTPLNSPCSPIKPTRLSTPFTLHLPLPLLFLLIHPPPIPKSNFTPATSLTQLPPNYPYYPN